MKKQLVLVTGATGNLGKYLVQELSDYGYALRLIVRNEEKALNSFKQLKPELIILDLINASEEDLFKACKGVDFVIHLAGSSDYSLSKQKLFELNAIPSGKIARAAKKAEVKKLVFASSTSLYHDTNGIKVTEETPLTPSNAYGESKIKAEKLIKESRVPFVFLRLTTMYGAGFETGFLQVAKMIKKEKMPLIGNGKNNISLVHASDAANAFLKAIQTQTKNDAFIISSPPVTQTDCLNDLADLLGVKPPSTKVPVAIALFLSYLDGFTSVFTGKRKLYPDYVRVLSSDRSFDCSKAAKMLSWKPRVEFKDGLQEFVSSINGRV
ncbi:MAG: NAD(P)-dependent oxidoreductase [Candidatus Micrarchaeota archaeon]